MSWRTKPSSDYKNLSEKDRKYLKSFDRKWDRKENGRCRTDALDRTSGSIDNLKAQETIVNQVDLKLEELLPLVQRFTVPRRFDYGWGIYVYLADDKVSCRFSSKEEAMQAYNVLVEYSNNNNAIETNVSDVGYRGSNTCSPSTDKLIASKKDFND